MVWYGVVHYTIVINYTIVLYHSYTIPKLQLYHWELKKKLEEKLASFFYTCEVLPSVNKLGIR